MKYEVITFTIENGTAGSEAALQCWNDSTNQEYSVIKSFDDLEGARNFYATVKTRCSLMGRYYSFECKAIQVVEYDEDGELLSGGDWWEFDIPEYKVDGLPLVLKEYKDANNITVKELADMLKVPLRTCEDWLAGRRTPDSFKQGAIRSLLK